MLGGLIQWPQLAAIAVLIQRGLEELYALRNTRRLITAGAHEAGRDFYGVVAVTHLGWIAGIFFLIPPDSPVLWPLAAAYVALQAVRYWVIATLGRFWTHRIITLDGAAMVKRGPYRWLRHPNYAVTIAETLLLPLVFEALAYAVIMTAIWVAVIRYKIRLEDAALSRRRDADTSGGSP
jgi:methyltransferase